MYVSVGNGQIWYEGSARLRHPEGAESLVHTKLARGDADKVSKCKVNSSYLIKDKN